MLTAYDIGLSGGSRLHDLFVVCEAVTPGEYKRGGKQQEIEGSRVDRAELEGLRFRGEDLGDTSLSILIETFEHLSI